MATKTKRGRVSDSSPAACSAWGALWKSHNNLDGLNSHLIHRNGLPVVFKTRKAAKAWIDETHGFIKHRDDLRREPHGWRLPIPVRITITPNAQDQRQEKGESNGPVL